MRPFGPLSKPARMVQGPCVSLRINWRIVPALSQILVHQRTFGTQTHCYHATIRTALGSLRGKRPCPSQPQFRSLRTVFQLLGTTSTMAPVVEAPNLTKVLVIGGSYAGLSAALNLADLCKGLQPRQSPTRYVHHPNLLACDVEITIIDERDGFCELTPCI